MGAEFIFIIENAIGARPPLAPPPQGGVKFLKNRYGGQISEILGAEFIFTIENAIWVRGPPLPPPGGGGLLSILLHKYYIYDLIGLEGLMPSMSACGYPISTLRYPTLTLTPPPPRRRRGGFGVLKIDMGVK